MSRGDQGEASDVQVGGVWTKPATSPFSDEAFQAFLQRVRGGAVERETERRLLFGELAELRALSFTGLRVPTSAGGGGLSVVQLLERLIDLSAADSSLGHVWRGHVLFVESILTEPDEAYRELWFERLLAGASSATHSPSATRLRTWKRCSSGPVTLCPLAARSTTRPGRSTRTGSPVRARRRRAGRGDGVGA
jgi:hypothetical protein